MHRRVAACYIEPPAHGIERYRHVSVPPFGQLPGGSHIPFRQIYDRHRGLIDEIDVQQFLVRIDHRCLESGGRNGDISNLLQGFRIDRGYEGMVHPGIFAAVIHVNEFAPRIKGQPVRAARQRNGLEQRIGLAAVDFDVPACPVRHKEPLQGSAVVDSVRIPDARYHFQYLAASQIEDGYRFGRLGCGKESLARRVESQVVRIRARGNRGYRQRSLQGKRTVRGSTLRRRNGR